MPVIVNFSLLRSIHLHRLRASKRMKLAPWNLGDPLIEYDLVIKGGRVATTEGVSDDGCGD